MSKSSNAAAPCPYCGMLLSAGGLARCPRCKHALDAQTLQAVRPQLGPWFVLDEHNPFAPGISWRKMLSLIERGRVGPTSIVRGPATGGFWKLARQAPGVATQLGMCWSCQASLSDVSTTRCDRCGAATNGPSQWPADVKADAFQSRQPDDVAADLVRATAGVRLPGPNHAPETSSTASKVAKFVIGGALIAMVIAAISVGLVFLMARNNDPPAKLSGACLRKPQSRTSDREQSPAQASTKENDEPAASLVEFERQQARRQKAADTYALAQRALERNDLRQAEKILVDLLNGAERCYWPDGAEAALKQVQARIAATTGAGNEPSSETLARQREDALRLFKLAKAREADGELMAAQELLLRVLNNHHANTWPAGAKEALYRIQKKIQSASAATTSAPAFFGIGVGAGVE